MNIIPSAIEQSGPGVDLSNLPEGISLRMSDPVQDLEYARNTVTLTYDLSGHEAVRLAFEAMEYGDEPHAPPPGPFGDDANFDGVAVSMDLPSDPPGQAGGVGWYEIQGLRNLSSNRFTAFDLDLDALVAAAGLAYNNHFRIRFCQYDDNPAPMDGVFLHKIALSGEAWSPSDPSLAMHLAMDDNAANPLVKDATRQHHQTLSDPGGDPKTNAHSVAGRVGTALRLELATFINCGTAVNGVLAAGHDFTIAFWWRSEGAGAATSDHLASNFTGAGNFLCWITYNGNFIGRVARSAGWLTKNWAGGDDGAWHHYALARRGATIEMWRDGAMALTDGNAANAEDLAGGAGAAVLYVGQCGTGGPSAGTIDDLRVYSVGLSGAEIVALANL